MIFKRSEESISQLYNEQIKYYLFLLATECFDMTNLDDDLNLLCKKHHLNRQNKKAICVAIEATSQ